MKAIQTRYHGPTNTKGARISARAEGLPVRFYPYDYAARDPHLVAAERFIRDSGWAPESIIGGELPDGSRAWVMGLGISGPYMVTARWCDSDRLQPKGENA